jgi:transcriptional regulator with XRE-family HTH domain
MNQTGADFMPAPRQLFERRMGEALAALLSQRHLTAKQIARAYKIDPSTAENLRKGHLSVPTLEKVIKAEGWALWAELGREMIGHGYPEHLQIIIEREANVQRDREAVRDRVRKMENRAAELGRVQPGMDT